MSTAPPEVPSRTRVPERATAQPSPHRLAGVTSVRLALPPAIGRRIGRFDRAVDAAVAKKLRGRPAVDQVFYTASALGDFSLLWHLIGTTRALGSPRHERQAVRLAVSLGVESVLVNHGVKSLFRRTRPTWEQHHHHRLRHPSSSSFPSGHATSGFMAATLLADQSHHGWPVWYVLATVVAASRVHVGIHHASDVLVGAVVGTALGRAVLRIWPVS